MSMSLMGAQLPDLASCLEASLNMPLCSVVLTVIGTPLLFNSIDHSGPRGSFEARPAQCG